MRTRALEINKQKVTGVLLAGGMGYKIYSASEINGLILKTSKKLRIIPEGSEDYKALIAFINIKYFGLSDGAGIIKQAKKVFTFNKTKRLTK